MKRAKDKEIIDFNVENEMAVLAAMCKNRDTLLRLTRELDVLMFVGKRHRAIFTTLIDLHLAGLKFDIDAFCQIAGEREFGGARYLKEVLELFDASENLEFHLDVLKRDSVKMNLRLGPVAELTSALSDPSKSLDDILNIHRDIGMVIVDRVSPRSIENGDKASGAYGLEINGRMKGRKKLFVPTGIDGLDPLLNEGLAKKKLTVIFGRPRNGKSSLVTSILVRQVREAIKKHPGDFEAIKNDPDIPRHLICPLEMGRDAWLDFFMANMASVKSDKIIKYPMSINAKEKERMEGVLRVLKETDMIHFLNKPFLKPKDLPSLLAAGKYDVVWFDLWEKMIRNKAQENIAAELDEAQAMAQEYDVHFVIVHQARRSAEGRGRSGRPTISELKNSGAYEEVADLVIGVRKADVDTDGDHALTEAIKKLKAIRPDFPDVSLEIGILKQRRGLETDKWLLYSFNGSYHRIGEYWDGLHLFSEADGDGF